MKIKPLLKIKFLINSFPNSDNKSLNRNADKTRGDSIGLFDDLVKEVIDKFFQKNFFKIFIFI